MSSDKFLTSSPINDSTNDNINNFTNFINNIIIDKLIANTMAKEDAMILRNMLIRIQTDNELLKVIRSFNASFSKLDVSWNKSNSSTSNYGTASSSKLANILMLL